MTTVQIIGIAAASVVVLLLVVALLVSRRRGDGAEADTSGDTGSFLDDAPQDTFAGLGRADQAVEDVTVDPGVERAAAASLAKDAGDNGLGLLWGPEAHSPGEAVADETEATGELQLGAAGDAASDAGLTPEPPADAEAPADAEPTRGAEPTPEREPAGGETPAQSGAGSRMVPLSDIIVTTSNKMVDLEDVEVRRMLTDLVTYEIDQASEFRRQGQTIDAVLQLTEAEKVSRALGMHESADNIRGMMQEIRGRA